MDWRRRFDRSASDRARTAHRNRLCGKMGEQTLAVLGER